MKPLPWLSFFLIALLLGCSDESPDNRGLETQTVSVENVGPKSALASAIVKVVSDRQVIDQGMILSKTPDADINTGKRLAGPVGAGAYSLPLAVLSPGTKYYVKAYASDGIDIVYGNELSFTTSVEPLFIVGGGVEDINGNKYKTVVIGNQEWMTENLRASKFNNGDDIPNSRDYQEWQALTTPAWTHYQNNPQYDALQGKLYNWYTVSDPRKVCPSGWHVSTFPEWSELIQHLGGKWLAAIRFRVDTTSWNQSTLATNESGFSAIHSGACIPCNDFYGAAMWWTSTSRKSSSAAFVMVTSGDVPIWIDDRGYALGLSLRCVKD